MHTNLDIAQGGVNDVLIRLLGAEPEAPLDPEGCGRVGTLPEALPLCDFLARCKERLGAEGLRYVDGGRPVRRLAVMGGSGGDALELRRREGLRHLCDRRREVSQFPGRRGAGPESHRRRAFLHRKSR